MDNFYGFLKKLWSRHIILIGPIVTILAISQLEWAYRGNDYRDILSRVLLSVIIGSILSTFYYWFIIKIFYKFNYKENEIIIKDLYRIHIPVYLLWLYPFHIQIHDSFSFYLNQPLTFVLLIYFLSAWIIEVHKILDHKSVDVNKQFKVNKPFQVILIILFTITLFLPLIQQKVKLFPEAQSTEKRQTAIKPKFSVATMAQFPTAYEEYYNDNFGFRNGLIKLNNIIKIKYLKTVPVSSVIIGKNGWLFFNSEKKRSKKGSNGETISDYQGLCRYSKQDLEQIKNNIEHQMKWLKNKGITGIIIICPNKETIYSEYLPDTITRINNQTRLDQLVEYLNTNSSCRIIDVRKQLRDAKKYYQVYYKTDTHWNQIGGFIAFQEIGKYLSKYLPENSALSLSDYNISIQNTKGYGDLAVMLSCPGLYGDQEVKLALKDNIIPTLPPKGKRPKIVFFYDSFSRAMRPFLENYFNVVMEPHNNKHLEIIEKDNPQIVIYEYVERYSPLLGELK